MAERVAIFPGGRRRPVMHCSPAIRCGPFVFTSGQTATDWEVGRPPDTNLPHLGDSVRVEVRRAFGNLRDTIEAAGLTLFDVSRVDNYYTSRFMTAGHFAARDEYYTIDPMEKPASTAVMVRRFVPEGCRYAVEGIAIDAPRESLVTDKVQRSPGRLPMGIRAGDFVFLSGRMASDYREGLAPEARTPSWIWIGSPIHAQTEYVLAMHRDILEAGGLSLRDIVKSEVFLRDPRDITGLDEVWQAFFPEDPPARSLFVVDDMAIPDAVVEINHIALHPESRLNRTTIATVNAPMPLFYEPQGVKVGPLVFLSTQVAHDEDGLARKAQPDPEFPHVGSRGRLQTKTILENVAAICEAAGGSLADVAKVQTHLTDLAEFDAVNEVWKHSFDVAPAWTVVELSRDTLAIEGSTMMCDVIACIANEA